MASKSLASADSGDAGQGRAEQSRCSLLQISGVCVGQTAPMDDARASHAADDVCTGLRALRGWFVQSHGLSSDELRVVDMDGATSDRER